MLRCGCAIVGRGVDGARGIVRMAGLTPRKRCPQRPQKFRRASQTIRQLEHGIVSLCSVSCSFVVSIITASNSPINLFLFEKALVHTATTKTQEIDSDIRVANFT